MSGFPGDLSKQQETTLAEFRAKLQAEVNKGETALKDEWEFCDDMVLLKFLRARKFVIADSFKMILEAMRWRQTFHGGVRTIRDHHVLKQLHRGVGYYRHADKGGHPIYWVRVRVHDKNERDLEEMKTYIVHQMELGRTLMHPPIEATTIVFDLSSVGVKNLDLVIGKFIADMLQNCYPECLAHALVYSAPFIFWGFWQLLKPFLDPKTASKIVFVKTITEVETYIDREFVPTHMGGNDTYEYSYAPTALYDPTHSVSGSDESSSSSSAVSSGTNKSEKKAKSQKKSKKGKQQKGDTPSVSGEEDVSQSGTDGKSEDDSPAQEP